ncbi:hypothetical protein [Bradyrhizobium sp. WYCCWR 12699]|uniref:hypothetical protein n=1 Tax=Bradyrhizobium sp. WYCCWR 12699 TaxID=3064203 RepID=UPI0028A36008|nr:hypothetical protein [Bradyrhizobium sp. WYCCWR 12699]MDT4741929.1 hypothetical protein [Bradyrhizobium sp. WYCCWR 12699]
MTRLTLVAAALIAAAVTPTQAATVRHAAAHRAVVTQAATDACVRAPAEGAYVSAPYTQPPCLPNTMTTY